MIAELGAIAGGDWLRFPEALRRFDAYMEVGGASARTRHAYRRELTNLWCDYLFDAAPGGEELSLEELSPHQLRAYLVALPANGSKRGDVLRAVKAFFRFALAEGLADRDPSAQIPVPRPKAGPVPDLGTSEARRLLRAAFAHEPRRGWAVLLALHTGGRVGSLCSVRLGEVDLERRTIYFAVAKGDRPYELPLNRPATIAARHLVELAAADGRDRLIGVGAPRFRQWLHAAEQSAGLGRVWPHLLRHTFSRRVARRAVQTGDLDAWRRSMNHADLSQWSRYNPSGLDDVREVLEAG